MADYRQTIQKVEDTLNDASRKLANKNSKAALALGEINTIQYLDIQKIIKGIEKYDVLVGIPDATTQRRRGEVTNAELAYLHTHGVTKASERQKIEEYITQGFDYKDARKKVHDLHMLTKGSPAWSIPPRPIIEPAIEDSKEEISKLMQNALRSFLELDLLNAEKKLKVAGMKAQNVVRAWFVNPKNNWAPNSPMTIKAKKSDRPLIDTGELRKSITYVVNIPSDKIINRIKKNSEKV